MRMDPKNLPRQAKEFHQHKKYRKVLAESCLSGTFRLLFLRSSGLCDPETAGVSFVICAYSTGLLSGADRRSGTTCSIACADNGHNADTCL